MRNISVCLLAFFLFSPPFLTNTFAIDSLKVHVVGSFKNETFKIYHGNTVFIKKMKSREDGFSFFIKIDENIKDLDNLNLYVYKKSRFGFKYRKIKNSFYYNSCRKYFILWRDRDANTTASLREMWRNKPLEFVLNQNFWLDNYIDPNYKCDKIEFIPSFQK